MKGTVESNGGGFEAANGEYTVGILSKWNTQTSQRDTETYGADSSFEATTNLAATNPWNGTTPVEVGIDGTLDRVRVLCNGLLGENIMWSLHVRCIQHVYLRISVPGRKLYHRIRKDFKWQTMGLR